MSVRSESCLGNFFVERGRGPENLGHVAFVCDSYELVGFQVDSQNLN